MFTHMYRHIDFTLEVSSVYAHAVEKCMYVCKYVRMYVCMCICTYVCMYVCVYVYMHVCMYVCMHVWYTDSMETCMHMYVLLPASYGR